MGTIIGELYDHEGYAARRLPDGTLTGTWTAATREFTAYVAACSCSTGSGYTDWYGSTDHPPTDDGEAAALAEWERVHARPLLQRHEAAQQAAEAKMTEALHTAGLLKVDGDPDVDAIIAEFWHPDGPHSPKSVASAALAIDELTRYLARATIHASTLPHASDVYRLVSELRSALGRLDQVLEQTSQRVAAITADGGIYDDRRGDRGPADTARQAQGGLDAARVALGPVLDALGGARRASGHLGHE